LSNWPGQKELETFDTIDEQYSAKAGMGHAHPPPVPLNTRTVVTLRGLCEILD